MPLSYYPLALLASMPLCGQGQAGRGQQWAASACAEIGAGNVLRLLHAGRAEDSRGVAVGLTWPRTHSAQPALVPVAHAGCPSYACASSQKVRWRALVVRRLHGQCVRRPDDRSRRGGRGAARPSHEWPCLGTWCPRPEPPPKVVQPIEELGTHERQAPHLADDGRRWLMMVADDG